MKFGNKLTIVGLTCWLVVLINQGVYGYEVPTYSGYVNDFAGVMSQDAVLRLEELLTEKASNEDGLELAIVTLDSLGLESIEDVALQIFDEWKIGKSDLDNGVLLLIAVEEREVRIQTGYGAEVFLNDAQAGRIIREQMASSLLNGDYDKAASNAVDSIILASNSQDVPADDRFQINFKSLFWQMIEAPTILIFFGALITYLISFLGRSKEWWPGGVIGAIMGWFVAAWSGLIGFGIFGLVLDYILSRNYKKWKLEHKATSFRRTWGGFHGGKPPIRFGGGMSGGGGATGRW